MKIGKVVNVNEGKMYVNERKSIPEAEKEDDSFSSLRKEVMDLKKQVEALSNSNQKPQRRSTFDSTLSNDEAEYTFSI